MAVELTERQEEILRYIQRVLESEGSSPSVQEIQNEFGFRSPNAAQSHLQALISKGVIERRSRRRRARGLRLVSGVEYGRGTGGDTAVRRPLKEALPTADIRPREQVEAGLDVFFNARHVIGGEFDGEVHAHSWRLRVVVLFDAQDQESTERVRGLGGILQEVVGELEGTVLNHLEPFQGEEPTLDHLATLLRSRVTSRLAPLNLRVHSITLWDQPIRYVTVAGVGYSDRVT